MTETKILPCPFCGRHPEMRINSHPDGSDNPPREWSIFCLRCSADVGIYKTQEDVIAAWNRRAPIKHCLTRDIMQIINAASPELYDFFDDMQDMNFSTAYTKVDEALWAVSELISKIGKLKQELQNEKTSRMLDKWVNNPKYEDVKHDTEIMKILKEDGII